MKKIVELDVPAMVHVASLVQTRTSTARGAHYINGDTAAFMQFLTSDLFKDFPTLKFIIPPWRRRRRAVPLGQVPGASPQGHEASTAARNCCSKTCSSIPAVYHQKGIGSADQRRARRERAVCFGRWIGAVKSVDPETGHRLSMTRAATSMAPRHLSPAQTQTRSSNRTPARVYGRLNKVPRGRAA